MKTKLYLMLLTMSMVLSAQAQEACAPLDYQEMKEMPVEQLLSAYCDYKSRGNDNAIRSLELSLLGSGVFERERLSGDENVCRSQAERIKRVLVSKGKEAKCT